jgi:hypothetical protein
VIYEVTPGGNIVWKWTASDHLDEFGFSPEALKLVKAALAAGNGAQAVRLAACQ